MTAAFASVLAKAVMPQQWNLYLTCTCLPVSVIGELVKGQWPTLQCLSLGRAKLTAAAIQELAIGQWPSLQFLFSLGMAEDANVLSVLTGAQFRWPQLRMLSLLHSTDHQTECGLFWLGQMYTVTEREGSSSPDTDLAAGGQAPMSIWCQLEFLALANQTVDASAFSRLVSSGSCPLQYLQLENVRLDATALVELARADVPELETVVLTDCLDSATAPYVAKGSGQR